MNLLFEFLRIFILTGIVNGIDSVEYGYEFLQRGGFIQAKYSTLCNESSVKFEIFFNNTEGIAFLAENKIVNSRVLVHFRQPVVLLNASFGNRFFSIELALDFFASDWVAWHTLEIRLDQKRLGLLLDGGFREGVFENTFLFPESDMENNLIYFGAENVQQNKLGLSYFGFMRNFQYQSCGCHEWRPVQIVGTYGVSFDNLRECGLRPSCAKGCSCLLFSWGGKKCDCSGQKCPIEGDDISTGFDRLAAELHVKKRFQAFKKSENIQYNAGMFGESLQISNYSWMILTSIGQSCFKNVFSCGEEVYYQFWLKPNLYIDANWVGREQLIMKHASSIQSPYGLEITRIHDNFRFIFTTNSNQQFTIVSPLPILLWNRISISFHIASLKLYLNDQLLNHTNKHVVIVDQTKSQIVTTKYLFVGTNTSNPNVEIDHFFFSTDLNILNQSSIQVMKLEKYEDSWKVNGNCGIEMKVDTINVTKCYEEIFKESNFSMGYYMSIIFNKTINGASILLMESSIFNLHLKTSQTMELTLRNGQIYAIKLSTSGTSLCYLEISVRPGNKIFVYQDVNKLVATLSIDVSVMMEALKSSYAFVYVNRHALFELTIVNADKEFATRALRIPQNRLPHYSLDFDDLIPISYSIDSRSGGFFGHGMQLRHPNNFVSFHSITNSCVRNINRCYNGLTIMFWMKIDQLIDDPEVKYVKIFSSGSDGIELLMDNANDFILVVDKIPLVKFTPSQVISVINQWSLLEFTMSSNRGFSLYINSIESHSVPSVGLKLATQCLHSCFSDESIVADEINVWDVSRNYLLANRYISKATRSHKLFSFTDYQVNSDIALGGSSKIIPTKYGQGVSLNGFGPRLASAKLTNDFECFSKIDECRRGITIRLSLRIDDLTAPYQIFVSSSQLVIDSRLGSLFVHLISATKSWSFLSKDILETFKWYRITISWRMDNGMKVLIDNKLVAHVVTGIDNKQPSSFDSVLYFGNDHLGKSNEYASILIDDLEFFDADQNNLASENKLFCNLIHSFDYSQNMRPHLQLGISGIAGFYNHNSTVERKLLIPSCFNGWHAGCRDCFTIRFWIYLNEINTFILQTRNAKLRTSRSDITVDIHDAITGKRIIFVCTFDVMDLMKNWNFMELSWDTDEGLLVFVNRELLLCKYWTMVVVVQELTEHIEISPDFHGGLDEIEMYRSRISLLYWNKVVDEVKIDLLLRKLRDKKQMKLKMASLRGRANKAVEFNGTNFVKFQMIVNDSALIPGSKEEIELSFKSFDNVNKNTFWISKGENSITKLYIKNRRLVFAGEYLVTSFNETKLVTEELEIHHEIRLNEKYNLSINQEAEEIVIKINSMNESQSKSIIGRDSLLPRNAIIYLGGNDIVRDSDGGQTNSSFLGVIYKARAKSIYNRQLVDIIHEISKISQLNPRTATSYNLNSILRVTEASVIVKASIMNDIVDMKIPLMIYDPFLSIILPPWDFDLFSDLEMEFSTFESRGLLIFIGNATEFVAVELYDSQLFFHYNLVNVSRTIPLLRSGYSVNDNLPHSIYLGRDISGNMKVYLDRRVVVNNLAMPNQFENSFSIIGFIGTHKSLPQEILSHTGFVGCLHFLRIGDVGYLNPLRWINLLNATQSEFRLSHIPEDKAFTDKCMSFSKTPCYPNPCEGGWCEPTQISASPQISDNYKCNCLNASMTLDNGFSSLSAADNYNKWIRNYLFESRSKPCRRESSQILITDRSIFIIDIDTLFPFVSVLDLEFLLSMKSRNGCIASLVFGGSNEKIEIIVVNGIISAQLSGNSNHLSIPDIDIGDGSWHGVQFNVRFRSIRLKIDNVENQFDLWPKLVLNVSRIIIGQCSNFTGSHFMVKNLMYNHLNIFPDIYEIQPEHLFYRTRYSYPKSHVITLSVISSSPSNSVTFLNNFYQGLLTSTIKLSPLIEIEFQIPVRNISGSFVHFVHGESFLSIILCGGNGIVVLYKNNQQNSKRFLFPYSNVIVHGRLIIDVMNRVVQYEDLITSRKHQLAGNIHSWNVGDKMRVMFGLNKTVNKRILAEDSRLPLSEYLREAMVKSMSGCQQRFIISNGKDVFNVNENWTQIMQSIPSSSVKIGQCKDINICRPSSCVNGICRSSNYEDTFCDCSQTEYMGDKCHWPKPNCEPNSCKNNGKCIQAPFGQDLFKLKCQCNGTGFTGEFCEESLCRNDSCLNNGKCYVIGNTSLCDCSTTAFDGERCENSLCNRKTCNNQGLCIVDMVLNTPVCQCNTGYIGDNCEISRSTNCGEFCLNRGVCSPYIPPVKLCSNDYCISLNESLCNCDLTVFRGESCELPEFGFNPSKDGVLIMDRLDVKASNYIRILIEPFLKKEKMILLQYLYSRNEFFYFYMSGNQLWLRYHSQGDNIEEENQIGSLDNINTLLVAENQTEIHFYLNSRFGNVPLRRTNLNKFRRKRNAEGTSEDYPKLIIGSNSLYENPFNGLLAGVQWNGRGIMDERNRVWKSNAFSPVKKLITRTFPYEEPYLVITRREEAPVLLLSFVFVLECLIIALYIMLKLRSRGPRNHKIEFVGEPDGLKLVKNNRSNSYESENVESVESEKIVSTLAVMTMNSPVVCNHETTRIVLVDNPMSLNELAMVDILIVPGVHKIALVLNRIPEIETCQTLFPVEDVDYEYACVCLRVSKDHQYAYGHMKYLNRFEDDDDIFELQVWKIEESWSLVCRPPNICFTSSVAIAGPASQVLIMNHYSSTISIWNLNESTVIWTTSFSDCSSLSSMNSITLAGNTHHIFINCVNQFQIVDFNDDLNSFQIDCEDYPFSSCCKQLISIQTNDFLLRTESQEVYLFNSKEHAFYIRASSYKINLVCKMDWNNETSVAMATSTGEIYMTNDIHNNQHCLLGPKNRSQVACLAFSPDASLVCAGYENNIIHVWRVFPDISLCHFHAIHESRILRSLQFSDNNKLIISTFPVGSLDNNSEIHVRIIKRN